MELIDKAAVVAEIERRKDVEVDYDESNGNFASYADQIHYSALDSIENFINTLEVKEADLNEELDEWMKCGPHTSYPWCTIPDAIKITAEHFYELGLNARKEESKEVVSTNINNSNVYLMSELPQA